MSITIPGKIDFEKAILYFRSFKSKLTPEEEKFMMCFVKPLDDDSRYRYKYLDLTFDSALDAFCGATANGIPVMEVSLYKLDMIEELAGTSKMAELFKLIGDTASITKLSYGWKFRNSTNAPMRLISMLKQSKSISCVAVFVDRIGASEATKIKADLVTLLQAKNYTLRDIAFHVYDQDHYTDPVNEEVRHYLNLNSYGRKALINSSHRASSYKWIEALASARNDISGLFYFLSANPTLCEAAAGGST